MSNIDLNEYPQSFNSSYERDMSSGFIGWLISKGIAKTESQAMYVLVGIVAVVLAIIIFVLGDNNEVTLERDPLTGEVIIPGQVFGEI
jgi:hypothetical protein